jgi:alpha 1,3-mannosyltransferase
LGYTFYAGDVGIIGTLQTRAQIEERQSKLDPEGHLRPFWSRLFAARKPSLAGRLPGYTICAPQLLHLDISNRPLWFNGWILSNKYAEERAQVGARFEVYLKEPTDGRKPDPWQLEEHNAACLTADETYKFTREEVQTLDMIVGIAKEVGAYGKSK